jgi:S1-C subfamily serine protease
MLKKALATLKLILQVVSVAILGFAISLGIHVSVSESVRMPTALEMRSLENVSGDLNSKEAHAVDLSRQSILQVLTTSAKRDGFAKMSGTYMTYNDRFYVITAAHGVQGECEYFFVATTENNVYECVRYVLVDQIIDYAIVEIEQIPGRQPVKLAEVVPSNREWRQETSALNETFYTGYPNGLGPLTFRGTVAGMSNEGYILIHSYAWPGSSGSGVFSYDGNLIGVVIALSVGFTGAGYDVLEDLVIVTPLFMIDWDTAYEIMDEPAPSGDTGDTGDTGQ